MVTVGILGGGQLGKMLCEAAKKLSINTIVIDPSDSCPASTVADEVIVAQRDDKQAVETLAQKADVITIEIESVSADVLRSVQDSTPVHPDPWSIEHIQDKFVQKTVLQSKNLPVAPFEEVTEDNTVQAIAEKLGYPLILKAKRDGFDGRGNAVVSSEQDIEAALEKLGGSNIYAEQAIDFTKELAVQIARARDGSVEVFPVVHTVHKNSICHTVTVPCEVSDEIEQQAKDVASHAVSLLKGAGVFTVELFLSSDNNIIINEIAPRVHNSGHYTIEGCSVSQFEQHLRAIAELELVKPELTSPAACMINILGERDGPAEPTGLDQAQALGDVAIHIYGKEQTRVERKMGHITVLAATREEAQRIAKQARQEVSI